MIDANTNKILWVAMAVGIIAILGLSATAIFPDAFSNVNTSIQNNVFGYVHRDEFQNNSYDSTHHINLNNATADGSSIINNQTSDEVTYIIPYDDSSFKGYGNLVSFKMGKFEIPWNYKVESTFNIKIDKNVKLWFDQNFSDLNNSLNINGDNGTSHMYIDDVLVQDDYDVYKDVDSGYHKVTIVMENNNLTANPTKISLFNRDVLPSAFYVLNRESHSDVRLTIKNPTYVVSKI